MSLPTFHGKAMFQNNEHKLITQKASNFVKLHLHPPFIIHR